MGEEGGGFQDSCQKAAIKASWWGEFVDDPLLTPLEKENSLFSFIKNLFLQLPVFDILPSCFIYFYFYLAS